jgi:hypothetical protein
MDRMKQKQMESSVANGHNNLRESIYLRLSA